MDLGFITEFLQKVSQALRHEDKICRISGCHGMAHVVCLVQVLFTGDMALTIEGVVFNMWSTPSFDAHIGIGQARIQVGTSISNTSPASAIVELHYQTGCQSPRLYNSSRYARLAEYLRLHSVNHGLALDRSILEACCNLLVLVPASVAVCARRSSSGGGRREDLRGGPLDTLLGPLPRARHVLNRRGCVWLQPYRTRCRPPNWLREP